MSNAATVLTKKSSEIMRLWEARARKEVASAYGTTSLALRDAIVGHLEQLAYALASPKGKSTAAIAKTTVKQHGVGKEHGRDRSESAGYSIEEVIFEYRIMRQIVIQVLEEEVELSSKEREIITDLCEQAVNDAAAEFSAHQRIVSEQFTAVLTHDLRNPMTAAKTSAELVLRRSNQPECLKYAGRIVDSINRMDTMIQDLLDAGRIHAGENLAANMVDCHPAEVAAEVIRELASAHGDRFVLSADADLQT
jgi:signal transduction histidine kinase